MNRRSTTRLPVGAGALAIERVLQAEREAEARIERVQRQAHAQLERARDDALAIVNRSMERIARWQHAHVAALEDRLRVERERASSSTRAQRAADAATVAAAVAQVARLLTEAPDDRST